MILRIHISAFSCQKYILEKAGGLPASVCLYSTEEIPQIKYVRFTLNGETDAVSELANFSNHTFKII